MKQISFFTRRTMAALTKEEGGPLSCSASSHPTSVPRINPFHPRLCGGTTPELPNKGGRKAPPCPGGGRRGGAVCPCPPSGCPSSRCLSLSLSQSPCLFPVRTFSIRSYLLPWLPGVRSSVFSHLLFLWGLGFAHTKGELSPRECPHPRSSGCFSIVA